MIDSTFIGRVSRATRRHVSLSCGVALVVIGLPTGVAAQGPPAPHSTVALPGAVRSFYRALNVAIVATIDGVERVYHFVVPGTRGVDALEGLREGSAVVVRYAARANEPGVIEVAEGTVTHVDRGRQRITVRFEQAPVETFRLTERAEVPTSGVAGGGEQVTISYTDANGRRTTQTFTREP